ncbi:MAG: hypothetical protein HC900_00235 [Methylacidiphilales bacterium]|nr:hypothetical protein [Candidatus Methylacidiphilales bacterium]
MTSAISAFIAFAKEAMAQFAPRVAAACVAAIVLPLGGYLWGHIDASSACRAAAIDAKLQEAKRSVERLQEAAANTSARAEALERSRVDLEQKVSDYERHLSAQPVAAPAPAAAPDCRLSDADARRLRVIVGGEK